MVNAPELSVRPLPVRSVNVSPPKARLPLRVVVPLPSRGERVISPVVSPPIVKA
jgi:hypothetical protein